MSGIIERIGSLAGTELGKATNLAHLTYQERMGVHNHTGRALVETVAEVARNHPNLVGIGAGLLVEQLLAEEKRRHDAHLAGVDPDLAQPNTPRLPTHHYLLPTHGLRLSTLKPGRVAMEVFGGIVLLKLAATGAKMFRHKHQGEVWFAPAARVRLWSGTIAVYYLVKSIRSPKLSAWRNAAVALFATDALKPVLRMSKKQRIAAQARTTPDPRTAPPPPLAATGAREAEPAYSPTPPVPSVDPWDSVGQVQTFGAPKRDPRPMPVWPSEATRADPSPEPVQTPTPPPIAASDGPFPPG